MTSFLKKGKKKEEKKREPKLNKITIQPLDVDLTLTRKLKSAIDIKLMTLEKPIERRGKVVLNLFGSDVQFYILDCEPTEGYVDSKTVLSVLPSSFGTKIGRVYQIEVLETKNNDIFTLGKEDSILCHTVVSNEKDPKESRLKMWILKGKHYVLMERNEDE